MEILPIVESREPILEGFAGSAALEPPKDSKILVRISGNATQEGLVWIDEDASLATVEDSFALRPELASRSVVIIRRDAKFERRLRCRLDRLSRSEKEKIKVYHGDEIWFAWDRCFGLAPTPKLALGRGAFLITSTHFSAQMPRA